MREAVRETRPGVDLPEQLGDPHTRQHGIEAALQCLGRFGRGTADRGDDKPAVGDPRFGQLTRCRQSGDSFEACLEDVGAAGEVVRPAGRDSEAKPPFCP